MTCLALSSIYYKAVTHGVSSCPALERSHVACLESNIPWEHLQPGQQVFLSRAVLLCNDFSEKMVVFQLYLGICVTIMCCGSKNWEVVAGLLVKV